MSKPSKPSKNLIITEGKDDMYVFHHLLAYHGIPEGLIDFKPYDGITILLEVLPEQLRASGLERLGVVVDADTDLTARWNSLKHILTQAGFLNIPNLPSPEGTIINQDSFAAVITEAGDQIITEEGATIVQEGLPKVGIWLMPDNKLPGMLEDFVRFLVPENDLLLNKAKGCLDEIPKDQRKFSEAHFAKAHIHTWLAWQKEPGTPLGSAINQRYLKADAAHAKLLIEWIKRLFELS
jgi:hypothetical protein